MKISDYTKKDIYADMRKYLFSHDVNIEINGVSIPIQDAVRTERLIYQNSAETGKKIMLDQYCTPSSVVLQTYERIGIEIEKSIQCAFLLQMFNIKGTDLLCSAFCFIISLLPCETRNDIYLALRGLSNASTAAVQGERAVNDLANTVLSTIDISKNIAGTVSDMFGGNSGASNNDIGNIADVEKLATLFSVPISIQKNISLILKALQLSKALNNINPNAILSTLWDLAQGVLYTVQCMVVQMVDELLNKIIQPIEKLLRDLTPGICFGTMADAIRNKIIQFIRSIKSKLLSEIADLFQSSSAYNLKFRANQKQCGWTIEMLSFITVINYILQNFVAIARACGVSPCSAGGYTYKPSDNITNDEINPFSFSPTDNALISNELPEQINNLEDLANKISEITNNGVLVSPENIQSIYDIVNKDTPQYLKDLIADGILDKILDSNYTLVSDESNKKVIFTHTRDCAGE